ncbi:MAG: patatin-like phospholipase family protein [Saprospiraceae bacterium]|nr:patatin-like phospholipase family protein [Saprospiraceae bacterium]
MKVEYDFGLVLSGGGFRGAAHIGVIKALSEAGIKPDIISGVSAGSLVGACLASGISEEQMLQLFKTPNLFSLRNYSYRKAGLLDTDKFLKILSEFLPIDNFNDLKLPLYIVATNMLTGKLTTFSTGNLLPTVLASCALPFVFSPVEINGGLYNDGGIINNFPVEPLIGKCKKIIGVYVNPVNEILPEDLNTSLKVLDRAFRISTGAVPYLKFKHCDLMIEPKALGKYNIFDRKHIDKMYSIGYEEGKRQIEFLLAEKSE